MKKSINYQEEAKFFLEAVGGKENITNHVHCFTRMRYEIIDKNLVDLQKIKSSPIAKGTNWNGSQLQIILGSGVVEKIFEETDKILLKGNKSNSNQEKIDLEVKNLYPTNGKKSFKLFFSALGDIFLPIIPALVSAGLLMGFKALFVQLGWIKTGTVFEMILNILTTTAFSFLAALVCWSTVKRFGGTPVIGIIIGIMFVSPLLPDKNAVATWNYFLSFSKGFETQELANQAWLNSGLALPDPALPWKIGFISIVGWQGSVLPPIALGIGAAYVEKGCKKVVPMSLNMIITPFITITSTFLIGLFVLGPILQLIEQGILIGATAFLKIDYGFGTALLAGTLQAIVITGAHQLLQGLEMQMVIQGQITGDGSIMNAVWTASIVSQGGAAMAVALMTKNKVDSKMHFSGALTSFFGITEPVIFGTNLPKVKPFLFGLAGGAAGGFIAGAFNITCPGMGVTVIPGLLLYSGQPWHLVGIIGVNIVSFSVAFILTFLLFKDKYKMEKEFKTDFSFVSQFKKAEKKALKLNFKQFIEENKNDLDEVDKVVNNYNNQKYLVEDLEDKIKELNSKLEDPKISSKKITKLEQSKNTILEKKEKQDLVFKEITQEYNQMIKKYNDLIDKYQAKFQELGFEYINVKNFSLAK